MQPESATAGTVISEVCGKTYLDDVTVIRAAVEQPLAAGKEIVLVCHSYGGIPGSAAAEGYQVHERHEKSLPGGIKHIVYLAAFALPEKGMSLLSAIGGTYAPFMNNEVCCYFLYQHYSMNFQCTRIYLALLHDIGIIVFFTFM